MITNAERSHSRSKLVVKLPENFMKLTYKCEIEQPEGLNIISLYLQKG